MAGKLLRFDVPGSKGDRWTGYNDDNTTGGEPPDMEQRIAHLERDVEVIKATMATKADVSELKADMHSLLRQNIMWSVGTIIAVGGLVFAIMRFAGPGA